MCTRPCATRTRNSSVGSCVRTDTRIDVFPRDSFVWCRENDIRQHSSKFRPLSNMTSDASCADCC